MDILEQCGKLKELTRKLRNSIESHQQTRNIDKKQTKAHVLTLLEIRHLYRQICEQIQLNKKTTYEETQKIDKKQHELEVLEFKKQILIENIKQQKQFDGQAIKKIKNGQSYIQQLDQSAEIKSLQSLNLGILQKIETELGERKKLSQQLDELNRKHQEQIAVQERDNQFIQKLPIQINQFTENVKSLQQFFEIPLYQNPNQKQLSNELALPLLNIYNNLWAYIEKENKKEIQVEIVEKTKNIENNYQTSNQEIKVTISKKEVFYPIVISIEYFMKMNIVVFRVESNNHLSDRNIFQFLVNDEVGQLIFKNEIEKSINNRYVFYHFMQNMAKRVTNQKYNEVITMKQFFQKLEERVINQIEFEKMMNQLKENNNCELQQIDYKQFRNNLELPEWINDLENRQSKYRQLLEVTLDQKIGMDIEKQQYKNYYLQNQECCYLQIMKYYGIEQQNYMNQNYHLGSTFQYFKYRVNSQNYQFDVQFIIKSDYPLSKPRFFIKQHKEGSLSKIELPEQLMDIVKSNVASHYRQQKSVKQVYEIQDRVNQLDCCQQQTLLKQMELLDKLVNKI